MKNRKFYLVVIIFISILFVYCGYSLYEKQSANYTCVTSLKGALFDIPDDFLEIATAIANINQDIDYTSSMYMYKNGETTYLLFDIDNVMIVVENSTTLELLDADDIGAAIKNYSMDGILFDFEGEKLDYTESNKDGVYKLIANVEADVSLTANTNGDFTGKLAYIQIEDYECTMFVGFKGEKYDDLPKYQKNIVNHITRSLTISEDMDYYFSTSGMNENEETINEEEYFSDIYHMLKVGETGYFCTSIYENEAYMINNVTIEELYTGNDAITIIKEYYNKSCEAVGKYEEAPDGYSWHVVRYSLGTSPDKSYANIKIEGLDGNRLKYQGESCTTRTYDMVYSWEKETDLYCYYAVPNGCTEYALEVGDRKPTMVEGAYQTVFYYVSEFE